MRLYHPDLDVWHDFPSDRAAGIARRAGWQDEPLDPPAFIPTYSGDDADQTSED